MPNQVFKRLNFWNLALKIPTRQPWYLQSYAQSKCHLV